MIRKKIAIFSGFYLPFLGGVERYTNKLSAELVKIGYDVIIVTTNHNGLPDYEKNDHIAIYRLPSHNLFQNRYPMLKHNSKYRDLMVRLDTEKVDYVLCNTRFQLTTLLGVKFAKRHRLKSIVIDHGSSHMSVSSRVLDFFGAIYEHGLTGLVKRYTKSFYGVSKRSSDWLGHFGIKSSGEFYNAVDDNLYEKFKNTKSKFSDKVVISYAGRILREKGVDTLLEAFSALNSKNTILVIAGDGPILADLKEKYSNKNIIFTGQLNHDDMMRLFVTTDIFCYPSKYPEGLPTAILEAGIMKSAIIATNRGGTKEVIISPEYGMIIKEDIDSLRTALDNLIGNPDLVSKMKSNIYARVKDNFTWHKTTLLVAKRLQENK